MLDQARLGAVGELADAARLAGIVGSVTDAIITVDEDDRITLFNAAAERMFGCKAEMALGHTFTRFIPEQYHTAHLEQLRKLSLSREPVPTAALGTSVACRVTGQAFPIEGSVSKVLVRREPIYTILVRDVTERAKAEQALADSRAQLAGIVGSAMDAIITIDENQRITLYNAAAERMFGYHTDVILGEPLDLLMPEHSRDAYREQIRRYAQTGVMSRGMGDLSELWGLRANGQEFPIEAAISQIEVRGQKFITAIVRDVSERKRANEQLDKSLSLLEATLESAADGILVLDLEGNVVVYNDKYLQLWDIDPEKFRNQNEEAIPEALQKLKDPQYAYDTYRELMENPGQSLRDVIEFADGRVLERFSQPQRINRQIVGRVWCFSDITDRRRAEQERARLEEQFLQAQKMEAIGTMAGGIAHDFNNILYAIRGFGELVLGRLEPGSQEYEDQQEVLQAADRAGQLVRQILTFSRKSHGKRVPVNLPLIVKEVAKMIRATTPSTIEVHHLIDEPEATVIADPIEIHQILVNLCANAAQAMNSDGGVLEIRLRRHFVDGSGTYGGADMAPGNYYLLAVTDSGSGIEPEVLAHIFEPFYTTKATGEGTGLGLSTVHGVVKGLGGKVTVYSELGHGTTFHVYLPAAEAKAIEEESDEVLHGHERILFVDDEEPLAKLGKSLLEDLGYTVQSMTSSLAAMSMFNDHPDDFDLIISDETMPKLKGSELATMVHEVRRDIPVILCTGFGQSVRQVPEGVSTILHKPISRAELSQAIRRALEGESAPAAEVS